MSKFWFIFFQYLLLSSTPLNLINCENFEYKKFNNYISKFGVCECKLKIYNFDDDISVNRRKRYILFKRKWNKLQLSYCISYPKKPLTLTKTEVENITDNALAMWSSSSRLRFFKNNCTDDFIRR